MGIEVSILLVEVDEACMRVGRAKEGEGEGRWERDGRGRGGTFLN